jgi:hypothetical protein
MSDEERETQKAAVAQVVATFNAQQRAAWQSLIGARFTGRVSLFGGFMGGGFGPGGPGGGGPPHNRDHGDRGDRGDRRGGPDDAPPEPPPDEPR